MIKINERSFLPKNKSNLGITEIGGKPVTGFYKLQKWGVLLYDLYGEKRVFIVGNKFNEFFFVSAHDFEGKTRYMFAMAQADKEWLGLNSLSYSEKRALAESTVKELREMKVAA